MTILGPHFSISVWNLKKLKEKVKKMDISEQSKTHLLSVLTDCISQLENLGNKFKYKRCII